MLRKRAFIAAWASLLAAPASATVTYTFTSDDGDFTFTSPSFFEGGNIPGPGGVVVSHSGNFDQVTFRSSDILLVSPGCYLKIRVSMPPSSKTEFSSRPARSSPPMATRKS
jgi:hypothetical protein